MIYTKTNAYNNHFARAFYKPLTSATFEKESVYWYDQHDWAIRNIPFNSFIDEPHWNHLRTDPTSKIFIFYGDEYYNLIDLEDWVETLKKQRINPRQVYIMCVDQNWVEWTIETFSRLGINGINVQDYNVLMNRVVPRESKQIDKRFSILSRNYNKWRLRLYSELVNSEVLPEHFNYTFNNINPYGKKIIYPLDLLKTHVKEMRVPLTDTLDAWIDGIPYTTKNDDVNEKLAAEVYDMILTAGINVVVESHFDPFWNFLGHSHQDPTVFSPAFPTEKLYKPIGCKTPFIAFSTPWFLKDLKKLGYKTFHPYIDESYDEIKENMPRLRAIVAEINRISNMSSDEFQILLENCKPIVEHNLNVMLSLKDKVSLTPSFKWVDPYLEKNLPTPGRGGEL